MFHQNTLHPKTRLTSGFLAPLRLIPKRFAPDICTTKPVGPLGVPHRICSITWTVDLEQFTLEPFSPERLTQRRTAFRTIHPRALTRRVRAPETLHPRNFTRVLSPRGCSSQCLSSQGFCDLRVLHHMDIQIRAFHHSNYVLPP